jgi:hypothetical protein
VEHQEIYTLIQERSSKSYKTFSHKEMLKAFDIDENDLKD